MIRRNLREVLQNVQSVAAAVGRQSPRLVAVSKTFPSDAVVACYEEGQRHFGENYVNELVEKARQLAATCPEVRWHFIGRLQSNKIKKIVEVPNLWCVETLETEKHASVLQSAVSSVGTQLNVFVQVNTSGEANKGGVEPNEVGDLLRYIEQECPNLQLRGLMTIGSIAESSNNRAENADFQRLKDVRASVCKSLGRDEESLELSMGMSQDYETAIKYGSTNVRVGSTIFGARSYPPKS
ncbi:proline synthetase associated protein [Aphelenchoides avenae]|nr:proline synthetase associated protein [Aphelenchus avenae]